VVAALRWYSDLILTDGVTPASPDEETRRELLFSGHVAMWTDFAGMGDSDAWPMGSEVGVAPLPLREVGAQGVTELLYNGLYIAADTDHQQECWEWIKFLSAQNTLVQGMPARRSALESDEFAAWVGADTAATYRALLDYANVPMFPSLAAAGKLQWLYQALEDVLNGASPEAALAEAQRRAEE
jgi:ABC-type glycerol-3-phosphate transport system substrate-binding protein